MSVERGADWGRRTRPPADLQVFDDPRAALDLIAASRRAGATIPPIGLTTGDLVRTLGGPTTADLRNADEALQIVVDLGAVLVDGSLHWFLQHLVARRGWLRGRVVVVANAAFLGDWNIAPRAHPGDGRLDTLEVTTMGVGERLKARSRLASGTHVPHPEIIVRRPKAAQFEFSRPTPVRLDGRRIGAARTLSVRIEPDAVELWI